MNDLLRLALRLVLRMIGTVLAATALLFVALEVSIDGGMRSVVLPPGANPASPRVADLIATYHLDDPLPLRYVHWVLDAVQGDFGTSTRGGVQVTEVITHRLPITLQITLVAMALAVLVGMPLGIIAAMRFESHAGRVVSGALAVVQGIPGFLLATFAITLFAVKLQWLPASGWVRISESLGGNLRNLLLPVATLAAAEAALIGRVIRADLIEVFAQDFIAAARSKGMSTPYIVCRHALRPAAVGVLNVIGLSTGSLISGAMIIEIVFGIGGLGQQFLEASLNRDIFLLLGLTTYSVLIYVIVNAAVDLAVFGLDPRISRE